MLMGSSESNWLWVQRPVPWEEGLRNWEQRTGGALNDLESEGRMLARNAAVERLLRALKENVDSADLQAMALRDRAVEA